MSCVTRFGKQNVFRNCCHFFCWCITLAIIITLCIVKVLQWSQDFYMKNISMKLVWKNYVSLLLSFLLHFNNLSSQICFRMISCYVSRLLLALNRICRRRIILQSKIQITLPQCNLHLHPYQLLTIPDEVKDLRLFLDLKV